MKNKFLKTLIVLSLVTVLFFFVNDKGYVAVRMQGYKALKVFAHATSIELTPEFNTYETEHFIIKYTDKDENIVRDIGRIFEKSYYSVGKNYGYYSQNKTIVFLYDSQQSMWDYQQSVQGQAVMGLYNMGIIHVLSPKAYMSSLEISLGHFEENGPILHEYVHKVIDDISGGNVELWLTEGLALYEELEIYGVEWAKGYEYEDCYSSIELRSGFIRLDATKSYRQSLDIVNHLIEGYGADDILELLDTLKAGNSMDKAFEKIYGMPLNEFIDSGVWKG